MKSLSVDITIPYVFVNVNNRTMAVPSFVLSTIFACFLTSFLPHLATLWMQGATSIYKVG